jgi:hypothetical protein
MAQHTLSTRPDTLTNLRRETPGAGKPALKGQKFYGLVELDAAGTVLYYRVEGDGGRAGLGPALDLTGLNFYTEVAPFRNVGDFRRMLDSFGSSKQPASSLDFVCDYEDGPLAVRVLLARIRERASADATKSILVHVRKAH